MVNLEGFHLSQKKKEFAELVMARAKLKIAVAFTRLLQKLHQPVDSVFDLQELGIKQLATEAAQPDPGRTDVSLTNAWLFCSAQ